jgi:hypothetical protein
MQAQLQEKDKTIQEKDKTIQEKDKTIQEKDKTIQEKDKETQVQLQEKDKKLAKMNIAGLLELKDSTAFQLVSRGTNSSHVHTTHNNASYKEATFLLMDVPTGKQGLTDKKEDPWTGLATKFESKSSSLLSVPDGKEGLQYANEADLQTYIHEAVLDAIYICNQLIAEAAPNGRNVQKLQHRREGSLLSHNKPDHTIIFESISGIDILTIEDKKPCAGISKKPKVLGQVFDFLMALARFGHPNPFGILTTFEQTWVCWVHEDSSGIATLTDRLEFDSVVSLVEGLPESNGKPPQETTPPSAKPCSPKQTSTVKKAWTDATRNVYVSKQVYKAHELVPVLCNAIFCGMQNIHWTQKTMSLSNDIHCEGCFLQLMPDGYKWVQGTLPFSGKPNMRDKKSLNRRTRSLFVANREGKNEYTVVELLGVGETSRALRAVTTDGDECVIKMYIRKFEDNVPLSDKKFVKNASASVAREVSNYHKIYPELKPYVWQTKLNMFHCVILPYFIPVENRKESLEGIADVLNSKFKDAKLCFAESDMRWRHVGMFQDNVYLFDLADLKELGGSKFSDFKGYDRHIDVLEKKLNGSSK